MDTALTVSPELRARVEAIAARCNLTASEVVADALENGRSLRWQENFLDKVAEGIAAARAGDFATPEEIERVLNKYSGS